MSNIFTIRSYYTVPQAFAWFSDLMVEHAEIFWSLFAVDMDKVLAEQLPDTWDSFQLFQVLNDYLRTDGEFFILPRLRLTEINSIAFSLILIKYRRYVLRLGVKIL